MRDHTNQDTLHARTQQLMQGPLKHIKAAALAAALLPLASIAAAPASAQTSCGLSGGAVCGFVFDDTNGNGIQDAGEFGLPGVKVVIVQGSATVEIETNDAGLFSLAVPTPQPSPEPPVLTMIKVLIPTGMQPSPRDVGSDAFDSDGTNDNAGFSTVTVDARDAVTTDFGFHTSPVQGPGTGTPGYWKNHPEAWPPTITIGNISYTRETAIEWLGKVSKDKTTTLFSSLVSAVLNRLVGNDTNCVNDTIDRANGWMIIHPVGSGVAASSPAWATGEPLHIILDNYNNGRLCAPHRN